MILSLRVFISLTTISRRRSGRWLTIRANLRVLKDIYVDSFKNVVLDYGIDNLLVPNYGDLGVKAFDEFRSWIAECIRGVPRSFRNFSSLN
ncbi:unnamed protein product [Cochlearia groenlandica]